MAIVLIDDGTLDTVLRCTECDEEFRYNFDPILEMEEEDNPDDAYDAFIDWAIKDATDEHECDDGQGGYTDCACRDCFEIAIGKLGKALCGDCEEAGCADKPGFPDVECDADGAYGTSEEESNV